MGHKGRHSSLEQIHLADDALAVRSNTSAEEERVRLAGRTVSLFSFEHGDLQLILAVLFGTLILAAWQLYRVAAGDDWHLAVPVIGLPLLLAGFLVFRQGGREEADQAALRQSEALRRRACHMARLCHWRINLLIDPTGSLGVDDYSGEVTEIFGVSPEQLQLGDGDYYRHLVHPDDAARAQAAFRQFLADPAQKNYSTEYRIRHADGKYRVIREIAEKVLDDQGRAIEVIGTIQDITDLHQAVSQLAVAEGQLGIAHRLAKLGYWYWQPPPPGLDHDRGYYYSPELLAILRRVSTTEAYSDEKYTREFVHPDDRGRVLETLTDYREGRIDSYGMEYRAVPADSMVIYLRSTAERRRNADGKAVFAAGIVQDVTTLRETALSLEVTLEQLQFAHRMANLGFWRWQPPTDAQGRPTQTADWHYYNYSAAQLEFLGIEAQAIHAIDNATYCERFVHPQDRARILALYKQWDSGEIDDYAVDYIFIRPDGRHVALHAVAHRARDAAGHPTFAIGLFQDVTALKEREQMLFDALKRAEAANYAKTQFLAHMSHELRTPLNAAIGFADTMALGLLGQVPPAYGGYAEAIASSGRHLLTAIDEILMAAHLELGTNKLEEQFFRLDEVMQETMRILAGDAISAEVAMEVMPPVAVLGAAPVITGDPQAIRLALRHVLAAAIKATAAGRRLLLQLTVTRSKDEEAWLDLVVTNQAAVGPAPLQAEPQHHRMPYLSSNAYLATARGGLHFGLDIARHFLELHGGALLITSTAVGLQPPGATNDLTMALRLPLRRLHEPTSH